MNHTITLKQIIQTIHADLIGKDSHRGITLTYGWFANQLGHFALGFIPIALLHVFGFNLTNSLIIVAGFWLTFEIYNAMSPLYKKEYKGNGSFKPHWSNLIFDTFTDLCFFWAGSLTYYFCVDTDASPIWIWLFFGGLVALFFAIRYWFLTKLYQQNAFFPYQFRLSQWNGYIRQQDIEIIKSFLTKKESNRHFLVFGAKKSGKTTLTVGIANEMSIRHTRSLYTTYSKWISLLEDSDDELNRGNRSLWSWLSTDFLLIDDINPGVPVSSNKYTALETIEYINSSLYGSRNISTLISKNVAWVVGECEKNESVSDWIEMLKKMGVAEEMITVVNLNRN